MASVRDRSQRLEKYFGAVIYGKKAILNAADAKRFLEAIQDQKVPSTAVERIIASGSALKALHQGLRFDVSPGFINQHTAPFIEYLSHPEVKRLCNGQFLYQLLESIVEPRTLWTAYVRALETVGELNERAITVLLWAILELLSGSNFGTSVVDITSDAQSVIDSSAVRNSPTEKILAFSRKIKHILSVKASGPPTDSSGKEPGGRHDNDFADFRKIALLPTSDEFLSQETPFYRRAQEIDEVEPEHRVAAHLDNQFRLYREDMLSELREDLQIALGQKKGRRSAFILKKLSLVGISGRKENTQRLKPCTFRIACQSGLEIGKGQKLSQEQRKQLWKDNPPLKHQAFGCLIRDKEIVSFATVDRDVDDLSRDIPIISLRISDEGSRRKAILYFKMFKDLQFLLVETPIFAYEPILRCLQRQLDLPLSQEILFHKEQGSVDESGLISAPFLQQLEKKGTGNIQHVLGAKKPVNLDPSQLESLLAGLKQKLSLIQGPPGTGKSFIGALLAKVIHDQTKEQILFLCYTNHALDQFLEDLLDIGISQQNIVRLGSKSTPRTEPLRLREQSHARRKARSTWDVIKSLEAEAEDLMDAVEDSFTLYNMLAKDGRAILDLLEFENPLFYEALVLPEQEDGMTLVGRDGKSVKDDYLLGLWLQGKETPGDIYMKDMSEESRLVWILHPNERVNHWEQWIKCLLTDRVESLNEKVSKLSNCQERRDKIFNESTREILKSKRIIGCTTTAAAMNAEDLRTISPGVVLLEEAGEVLESHILTALSPETKQLILIGDHQQLRPKVNKYELTVERGDGYNLNRSLFERLVLAGYPHSVLYKQHRMCPEISTLVRQLTYPELEDGPQTLNRPAPRGLQDRVIFFHHEIPEMAFAEISDRRDEGVKGSRSNVYEVHMVLKIVKYLGQQGYGTDKLVVLTPYLGQLHLLRDMLSKENDPVLNDLDSHDLVRAGLMSQASSNIKKRKIKLSTIDNYQGEESEVVIASLTRSNQAGEIGFMRAPQRLNVLLSRARDVLIMIGNANTFKGSKKGRETWGPFIKRLNDDGHLYDGLPVKCEQHPHITAVLSSREDFETECPDGGCPAPCGVKLSCGVHDCPSKCHQLSDHSKMTCYRIVHWTCSRSHQISQPCHQIKGACRICNEEDRAKEIKRQRDIALDANRERKQKEYARELAKIQDEIAQARRVKRDADEEVERKRVLQQHKDDLAQLTTPTASTPTKTTDPITNDATQNSAGTQKTTPAAPNQGQGQSEKADTSTPHRVVPIQNIPSPTSSARDDWEYEKKYLGANSPEIDSLMSMIGLEDVKRKFLAIKSQVDTAIRQNVDLSGERFGSVLLGNPGTGKTTVARLYARFLASVGVLPGNHIVETTGSRLANDEVSGCKKTIEEILNKGGGALFIDEAYQLVGSSGHAGTQVLDFLLAEVENLTGKLVVILAGYQRQMEPFFAHNPGIPSRFPHELKFADYEDNELLQLLQFGVDKRYRGRMKVEGGFGGLYCRVVARRIGRGRGQDGFGNARAVENVRNQISERQANRLKNARRANNGNSRARANIDDLLLTREDLLGPEPSEAVKNCSAWAKLQSMTGLGSVKKTIQALLDSMRFNYQRELEEKPLLEFTLNKVFLGSPGTGKTTVAKLYGQILVDMGLLSNGEVVVKNPSDFVGSVIGESEKTTKGILASTVGKVLVIDEAYGLFGGGSKGGGAGNQTDIYRTAVVDTLVAEIQGVPGDNRCVLLLGYKDQMEEMFQNTNPGLTRRFPLDSAFVFEDFSPDELGKILDLKLSQQGFSTSTKGRKTALEVVERARNRAKFGNAGEVDILLNAAKLRHQQRISSSGRTGAMHPSRSSSGSSSIFEPEDFDPDFSRADRTETNIPRLFEGVIGCEDVIEKLEGYSRTVKNLRAMGMDPREGIPFNFLFRGPPGTGKTTTARKIGKVYYDMGFLSTAEVVECSVTDLVGQYVGQTGPKTQAVFEKALGKVLFIDEAYRLAEGHFAKESMDEIVDCITKPRFAQKLIIILAGYDADINRLMAVNPGLTSRFPESLQFQPLSPDECIRLLTKSLQKQKIKVEKGSRTMDLTALEAPESTFLDHLRQVFNELSKSPGWANGRDVETATKNIFNKAIGSLVPGKGVVISEQLVKSCLDDMVQERIGRLVGANPAPTSHPVQPVALETHSNTAPTQNTSGSTNTQADKPVKQEPAPPPGDMLAVTEELRDAGVTDDIWDELQEAKARAKEKEQKYLQIVEDETKIKTEVAEMRENEAKTVSQMQNKSREDEDAKRRHEEARVARELARRKKEEELERIERQRKKEEERRRKERKAQQKLRSMGVCVAGYRWNKIPGGYRCAGGSHYVSDAQLGI